MCKWTSNLPGLALRAGAGAPKRVNAPNRLVKDAHSEIQRRVPGLQAYEHKLQYGINGPPNM